MLYAKPSTPTNIRHSNPPNQLPTYHFASFPIAAHTQSPAASPHTLYTVLPALSLPQSATQCTALQLPTPAQHMLQSLHLFALAAWQYTLNATQPSMNHQTVASLHQRTRTPAHRFLKRTTKYLLNHKMTHCSTYTTPDLPPTLAARLAICKGIHSNKYPPLKSS